MSRLSRLDIDAYRAWLVEESFSGIVHVAGDDDEEPLTIAMGLANRAAGLPIHPGTRFGTASTTKLLTGLLAARLVERGVVRYEDRLVDLLGPEVRPQDLDERVTLHHLLSHTSGVGDYADEYDGPPYEQIWEVVPPGAIRGPRDVIRRFPDLSRTSDPGDAVRYNNGAYVLAGVALEEASGRTFYELVRDEVFDPLGMASSGFWALDDAAEPDLAIGYQPPDPEAAPGSLAATWRTNVHGLPAMGQPDGGAQATAADLVRCLDALTGRRLGAGYLSADARARLIGPYATSEDMQADLGLGAITAGGDGPARIGHAGEDPGFSCRCWVYVATGERVVVQSNVTDGSWQPFKRLDELLTEATTA
ncbi:MAG: beta-lactamase family protein [Chloroflexota bacterium]|nr:beta-lactamase family protein [Chloroflexota bacterium]